MLWKNYTKEEHKSGIITSLKWHNIPVNEQAVDEYLSAIDEVIPIKRGEAAFPLRVGEASLHGPTKQYWNKIWGR